MKLKDLKIGEEYAAGSKNHPNRVTLLSVGGWVPYRLGKNRWQNNVAAHEKEGAGGCRVQRGGAFDVIMPAQILCTWAEHEASEAKKKAAGDTAEAARNRRQDRAAGLAQRMDLLLSEKWGMPFAQSYSGYSAAPEHQDAYLDGLSELVALAERAGRGEG